MVSISSPCGDRPNDEVLVGGNLGSKTKDNPTGQNILVTFGPVTMGRGGLDLTKSLAHEGSHIADGADWIKSGFSPRMNPTSQNTERRA